MLAGWELAIVFLKLASTCATVLFGLYGLGVEHRDDKGRLTPRGRIALWGIIVSGLLTGAIQIGESKEQALQAREDAERSRVLLTNVQKSLYLFKDVTAEVEFYFEFTGPELNALKAKLLPLLKDQGLDPGCSRALERAYEGASCAGQGILDGRKNWTQVRIQPNSPLFPKEKTDIFRAISALGIDVMFGRKHADLRQIDVRQIDQTGIIWVNLRRGIPQDSYFVVDLSSDFLRFGFKGLQIAAADVYDVGVTSFVDLLGGTVIVSPYGIASCPSTPCFESTSSWMSASHIASFRLSFPFPKALSSVGATQVSSGAEDVWVINLPEDLEKIDRDGHVSR